MIKNIGKLLVAMLAVSFLFVLLPTPKTLAGSCMFTSVTWSAGSSTTDIKNVKNGDKVNLNVGGAPNGANGVAQGGCKGWGVNFRIQSCTTTYVTVGAAPIASTVCDNSKPLAVLNGTFDSNGQNAIVTWTVDTSGLTGAGAAADLIFSAAAGDSSDPNTNKDSSHLSVPTGLSGSNVYACQYNNNGTKTWGCATPFNSENSSCTKSGFNCDANTCKLTDQANCGKPVNAAVTHKECKNGSCQSVSGAGSDNCPNNCVSTNPVGPVASSSTQTFNLINPIGVTDFQDLVNIIGKWIFNLAIPIAVIIIIYAGVIMLTSGGNPGRFQKGAKALWYAVLGLAVVLIGKGFVTLVQSILSLRNK